MLELLEPIVDDPADSAHLFAKEIQKNLKSQFSYLLEPGPGFQPIYWLASYLSLVHCQALSENVITEAKIYLKSKLLACSLM